MDKKEKGFRVIDNDIVIFDILKLSKDEEKQIYNTLKRIHKNRR